MAVSLRQYRGFDPSGSLQLPIKESDRDQCSISLRQMACFFFCFYTRTADRKFWILIGWFLTSEKLCSFRSYCTQLDTVFLLVAIMFYFKHILFFYYYFIVSILYAVRYLKLQSPFQALIVKRQISLQSIKSSRRSGRDRVGSGRHLIFWIIVMKEYEKWFSVFYEIL